MRWIPTARPSTAENPSPSRSRSGVREATPTLHLVARPTAARRAGDVVLLVVGIVVLILNASSAAELTQIEESIVGVVSALPTWAHEIFAVSYALAALFAISLVVAAVVDRRWDILGYAILSVVLAVVVGLVLADRPA